MNAKKFVLLFSAFVLAFLCSCGEESGVTVGIWDGDGALPYDYSLTDYVVLGDYNGIPAPDVAAVTYDEKAATESRAAILIEKTEPADAEALDTGYIVKADVTMTSDGAECDIAAQKDFYVIIDGGTYFEGIEDPYVSFLAGKAAEEAVKSKDCTAAFTCPEWYADSRYAGKTVTVNAKTKKILAPALSEVDDTEVSAHTQYATLDELISALSLDMSQRAQTAQKYAEKRIMWQTVAGDATIFTPLPKSEVERCKNEYIGHYRSLASYNGCSYSEYVQREGLTENEIIRSARSYADKKVREELVAFAIAEEEGLLLAKAEYEERAYKLAASMGYAGYEELVKYNSESSVYVYLTWERAADFIAENAVYTQSTENE